MPPRRIIIDTDPGRDDAIALLLALGSPDALEVAAVTTVAGNVPLALTSANALRILELAGRPDVPVHAGCDRPLLRSLFTAEDVHGAGGLEGCALPEPVTPLAPGHAVDAIISIVRESPPGTVTLCALGPLTNVATALARAPDLAGRLESVVFMGGSVAVGGNTTAAAEFNIYVDPQAAAAVFASGARVVMVPLDLTWGVRSDAAVVARFRALGTACGDVAAGLLAADHPDPRGVPVHDPCVLAYALRPDLFEGRAYPVAVETAGEVALGHTVVDRRRREKAGPPNALVLERADAAALLDLMVERIGRLP